MGIDYGDNDAVDSLLPSPEEEYDRACEDTFAKRLAILLHKNGVISDQGMMSLQFPSSDDLEEVSTYNPFE